jgi:cysteinyl-tRNA synthetase
MAMDLLGAETGGVIDIHSGGEDNIFPHHECEIAQARCVSGAPHFARYWFHTRHLIVEGKKMSKSLGNFYTLADLLAKGASPAAVRLELTKTHYRDNANFTFQGLKDQQRQLDRWSRLDAHLGDPAAARAGVLTGALGEFTEALCNDLNVAGAAAALNTAVGKYRIEGAPGPSPNAAGPASDEHRALRTMLETLGVLDLERAATGGGDDQLIEDKIAERNQARADRDWATSDRIRDELAEMGVALHDGPEGTTWKRVVK